LTARQVGIMSERSDRTAWFVALRPAFSLGLAHEASNDVGGNAGV
jgi:hypothetical protein